MKKLIGILTLVIICLCCTAATADTAYFCGNCGEFVYDSTVCSCGVAESHEINNVMLASVDGSEPYFFELVSAVKKNKHIVVVYETYDPRGDVLYKVTLTFDKYIEDGYIYQNAAGADDFEVYVPKLGRAKSARVYHSSSSGLNFVDPNSKTFKGYGGYALELVRRSPDWRSYTGLFSAELELTTGYGEKHVSSSQFDCYYFHFTLN